MNPESEAIRVLRQLPESYHVISLVVKYGESFPGDPSISKDIFI